jgi:hypothetical protein
MNSSEGCASSKITVFESFISSKSTTWKGCISSKIQNTGNVSATGGLAYTLLHIPVATGDEEDLSNCNCNERGNETNRKEKRETERERECVCVCVFLWEKRKRGFVRTELLQAHSMDQQQQHEDDNDTFKCRDLAGLHKSLVQEAQVLHGLVCTIVTSKGEAEPVTFKKAEAIISNFPMSLCLCLSLCLAFFFVFLGFFAAFWV